MLALLMLKKHLILLFIVLCFISFDYANISGLFYNVINNMYSKKDIHIKLGICYLSKFADILVSLNIFYCQNIYSNGVVSQVFTTLHVVSTLPPTY